MTNDEMLELCNRVIAMADELWNSNKLEYSHYFDLTWEIEHIVNILKPKKTNGDRLREMSDEELADLLDNSQCAYCAYEEGCDDNAECSRGIFQHILLTMTCVFLLDIVQVVECINLRNSVK